MQSIKRLSILALSGLLIASCSPKTEDAPLEAAGNTIPVTVQTITADTTPITITASGQFTTNDETFLSFKTGGIIASILVNEGDKISKGQLLATLNLTEINAQVQQARIGLEKAQRDYDRVVNLFADSVATLEQKQNAKSALDLAKQQVAAAEFNLTFSEIRALSDGYILKKFANPGQLTGFGSPVFQVNGATKGNWILKLGLSDKQWAQLSIDDVANITCDALPGEILQGKVIRKAESTDPYSGTFVVEVALNIAPKKIASGMFGAAVIQCSKNQIGYKIPYESLLDGNAGEGFVFVTRDGKTALRQPVTIAEIAQNYVLITDGLQPGDKLIVAGSPYLTHNSPIAIN